MLFPQDGEGLLGQVLHQVGVRRVAAPGQQGAQIEKHGLVVGVEELVELCLAQGGLRGVDMGRPSLLGF